MLSLALRRLLKTYHGGREKLASVGQEQVFAEYGDLGIAIN